MDLSVITVNYNTKEHIRTCLSTLEGIGAGLEYEVFVVDNNSSDGSQDFLNDLTEKDNYHVIFNMKNVGFAKANNQVLRILTSRYVMLLNPDTEMTRGGMEAAVEFMEKNKDVGIMGPAIFSSEGKELKVCRKISKMTYDFFDWIPILNKFPIVSRNYRDSELDYEKVSDVDFIQGACMVISREALEQTGILDERFFMYSEEEDLCRRMKKNGWRVVFNPAIKIRHYWGAATEKEKFNKFDLLFESKYLYYQKVNGSVYAEFFRWSMIAIMLFRRVYYSLLMLRGDPENLYKYQKDLSKFIFHKLCRIK